jgi:hypothetical protein
MLVRSISYFSHVHDHVAGLKEFISGVPPVGVGAIVLLHIDDVEAVVIYSSSLAARAPRAGFVRELATITSRRLLH